MSLRSSLPLFGLLMTIGAQAVERPCELPGEPAHWVADACMFRLGTDDGGNEAVQACIARRLSTDKSPACTVKRRAKADLCASMKRSGAFAASQAKCRRDPAVLGPTVRNGGL